MACHAVLADRPLLARTPVLTRHCDLADVPQAASLARRFVRDSLHGVADEVVDDVLLLTSEMVTNVVLHARTRIHLGLSRDTETVLVAVQDYDGSEVAPRTHGESDLLWENGYGMVVVASLADDFGWQWLAEAAGKVMWFTVALHRTVPTQRTGAGPHGEASGVTRDSS